MKYFIGAFLFIAGGAVAHSEETQEKWTCIARTPVLARAYSGSGASEAEARANALNECQDHALFGCYVASCDH